MLIAYGQTAVSQTINSKALRNAWIKLESCRAHLESSNEQSQYLRCLAEAMPASATQLEKMKLTEFLEKEIQPKTIFECPKDLLLMRGQRRAQNLKLSISDEHSQYACFEVKLSGAPIKGEIEFRQEPLGTIKVSKVRFGF